MAATYPMLLQGLTVDQQFAAAQQYCIDNLAQAGVQVEALQKKCKDLEKKNAELEKRCKKLEEDQALCLY
jgi:cell division protein FtsB